MKIFKVVKSNNYGDFGESEILSYHKSREGAYLKLDQKSSDYKVRKNLTRDGYYYSGDYLELYVEEIKIEE